MGKSRYGKIECQNNKFNVGAYVRLSMEDEGDKEESNSITSQKEMIQQYLRKKEELYVADYYVDDGYCGTNFNRPSFQRLLSDIKSKKINTVIVKDLSRFGRNFLEVGNFFENIFPEYNVRFISLIENIDSYERPASLNNLLIPFRNFLNDEYCKDLSKKINTVKELQRKKGIMAGAFTPYGYKKDPESKGHLIVDEEVAWVVKRIFKEYLSGSGYGKISQGLSRDGIESPLEYKERTSNYKNPSKSTFGKWSIVSVQRILMNEAYIGSVVQGKEKTIDYKTKKTIINPRDKWVVVPNMHEPIISKEDFAKVQEIRLKKADIKIVRKKQENIFAGILRCADCGSVCIRKATGQRRTNKKITNYTYYCSTRRRCGVEFCSIHKIRGEDLENILLKLIQKQVDMLIDLEKTINQVDCNKMIKKQYENNQLYINKLNKNLQNEKTKKEYFMKIGKMK